MKKIFCYILLIVSFISCGKKKENITEIEIYPRSEMKAILDSFIVSCNDKNLIYELYIDKIRNWDYDIVLYSGKKSLTENSNPIMKYTNSNVTIHIYSGVEHFFGNSLSSAVSITPDSLPEEIPIGNYWLISEIDNKINIIKDEAAFGFPFYQSSRIKFEMPEVDDNEEEPEWAIESLGRKK